MFPRSLISRRFQTVLAALLIIAGAAPASAPASDGFFDTLGDAIRPSLPPYLRDKLYNRPDALRHTVGGLGDGVGHIAPVVGAMTGGTAGAAAGAGIGREFSDKAHAVSRYMPTLASRPSLPAPAPSFLNVVARNNSEIPIAVAALFQDPKTGQWLTRGYATIPPHGNQTFGFTNNGSIYMVAYNQNGLRFSGNFTALLNGQMTRFGQVRTFRDGNNLVAPF